MKQKIDTKQKFVIPETLVILFSIILLVTLLTYIIPAGQFERVLDEVNNKTMVVPGTYMHIDQNPVSFFNIPTIMYAALVDAAGMIMFVIMIGGSLGILTSTGTTDLFAIKAATILKGKEKYAIFLLTTLFGVLGTTIGFGIESVAFMPMAIAFAHSLGYDKMTGIGLLMMSGLAGSTAGILNPFNVGMAQTIAELPMFSGAWLRIILFVVLMISITVYLTRYGEKVKNDPTKGILFGSESEEDSAYNFEDVKISGRNIIVMFDLLIGLSVLVWGSATQGWSYKEISGLFFVVGIISGIAMGYSPNKISKEFVKGTRSVVGGAIVVGFARAIQMVLNDGLIIDTIINSLANVIQVLPRTLRGLGMYFAQTIINLFIVSSSGQAVAVMPIMIPLADLVGISRQTAVLAFQLGDGFTNYLYPTCAALFVNLSAAKVPYEKWLKFYAPVLALWICLGALFVMIATIIGY